MLYYSHIKEVQSNGKVRQTATMNHQSPRSQNDPRWRDETLGSEKWNKPLRIT